MRSLGLVVWALSLCWGAMSARAETDHTALAKASLIDVIRPGYSALSAATGSLNDKVAALCKQPSTDALQAAKDAFAGVVDAWSKVEIFRFGPIVQDRRYQRVRIEMEFDRVSVSQGVARWPRRRGSLPHAAGAEAARACRPRA